MILELKSFEKSTNDKATISRLFVDGEYFSFVLEDKVRELPLEPPESVEAWVARWKIAGQTAIPSGRYRVVIDKSERFSLAASNKYGRPIEIWTPHILDVPGFTGIRIHAGNTDVDTEGCLLPGLSHPTGEDQVGHSRDALDQLMPILEQALRLAKVMGGQETWTPGTPSDTVWHYEQVDNSPQAVEIHVDRTELV